MKTLLLLSLALSCQGSLIAQNMAPAGSGHAKADTLVPARNQNPARAIGRTDTSTYYYPGRDDPAFNKKYPVWKPAVQVVGTNVALWVFDRYVLNVDFSHIGLSTWKYNIQKGWEWDDDRFGINFIGHPYTGSMYFNAARSQGYNFWQSAPFAIGGSVMWEYFGENTRPSFNDVINTPVNGVFLGEIFYRLSSNILDDRTYGFERFTREFGAFIIDPERGLNRLLQGRAFRHTTQDVYQKEPLDITIFGGVHKINNNNTFLGRGPTNAMLDIQLDYGDPFNDSLSRKPYDFFRLRTEFSFGVGRKILDNVIGYGVLVGGNVKTEKFSMLYGAFQYYDYWDNKSFELGAIAFGGGVVTHYDMDKSHNIDLYVNAHLGLVPLAGNSTRYGPDTSQVRDYTYNDGLDAKFEASLNLGKHLTTSVSYNYYRLYTFHGPAGTNNISIVKPRIVIQITEALGLGIEHYIYYDDRYLKNFSPLFSVRTEQKIFLTWFIKDKHGHAPYKTPQPLGAMVPGEKLPPLVALK